LNTDYTLKDGQAVSIDRLEVGGVVMMNGAPVPDGEYELQDGTKCTVTGGVISAITPAGTPALPDMQAAAPQIPDYAPKFAAYDEALSKYETRFTEQQELIAKQDAMLKGLFEIIEKIAASPSGDPAGVPKSNFASDKVKNRESILRELSDSLASIKKSKTA
jgi:hypothetical protein